jgi:hypothetical protein
MKRGFVWAEKAGLQKVRKQPQVRICLLTVLPCVLVIACLTPHIIIGETSLVAASDICEDNFVNRLWENQAEKYDLESFEDAVEQMKKNANDYLQVTHELNIAAAAFSVVTFLMWVFFTAHGAHSATRLDQTGALSLPLTFPSMPWLFLFYMPWPFVIFSLQLAVFIFSKLWETSEWWFPMRPIHVPPRRLPS